MASWSAVLLISLCTVLGTWGVRARQQAACHLTVQGSSAAITTALDCLSTLPVAVLLNAAFIHDASEWTGVSALEAPSSRPSSGPQGSAASALLYFCGDYDLHLLQPTVRELQHVTNNTALLRFCGNSTTRITGGVFSGNSGTALLTMQTAVLRVQHSTFTNCTAYSAAVIHAADTSSVTISNTTVTGSQALAPAPADKSAERWHCVGGAVLTSGEASVVIEASQLDDNKAAFGAVIASTGNSSVSISDSVINHNSAGVAGGVLCAEGNSSQVVVASAFDDNMGGSSPDFGAAGALFLRDGAMANITTSTFTGNHAAMWGGALYAQNYTKAIIRDSSFTSNYVSSWGGAANIYDDAVVNFDNCTMRNNSASEGGGGGVMAGINSTVTFSDCVISNNSGKSGGNLYANGLSKIFVQRSQLLDGSATTGAAMHCDGNTTVKFDGCLMAGNNAKAVGGGLYIVLGAHVTASNCSLQTNHAQYGGGVMVASNGTATLSGTKLQNNSADNSGGAVYTDDTATVLLQQGCQVTNNTAANGGGLFCIGNSSVTLGDSSIQYNVAKTFGGGADIGGNAMVKLNSSTVSGNAAETGGALRSSGNSNTSLMSCQVSFNTAKGVSGAVYASGQAQVLITGSGLYNNSGGALFQDTTSKVVLQDSHLANNSASMAGGALYSRDSATVDVRTCILTGNSADMGGAYCGLHNSKSILTTTAIRHNRAAHAGGAMYIRDSAMVGLAESTCSANFAPSGGCANTIGGSSLSLSQSVVDQNSAYRGGGIYLDGTSVLTLDQASSINRNQATTRSGMFAAGADFGGVGGGVYLASANFDSVNLTRATRDNKAPFGSDVGVSVQHIGMVSNSSVRDFASRLGSDEGLLQLLVNVSGPRGLPCHGAQVQAVLDGSQFLGINRSDSSGNVFMILKVQKPPGHYDIALSSPDAPWVPQVEMKLQVRSCIPGEVTPSPDACLECPIGYFSLDPSKLVCDVCPAGAECSGSFIIPVVGMWTSTADSVQVHSCPNPASCQGDRADVKSCAANLTCRSSAAEFSNSQCGPEYHGHLCGKCVDGYAPTGSFVCRKCVSPALLVALYAVAGCMMLLCIRLLCFWTRTANRARCQPAQGSACSARQSEVKPSDTVGPKLQPTDLIKPLILFLQSQLIVATASGIDWKAPMSWMVAALGWVWSATSPETLSLQCLMSSDNDQNRPETPAAFKAALFHLLIPFALLALSLLIDICTVAIQRRRHKAMLARLSVADSLLSNALVAAFIFLPTVVRTLFSLFACVPIDQPAVAPAKAAALGTFWASDLSLQCFQGVHKAWALGLGIPFVLLICVCLPAGIVYKTVAHRKELNDPNFTHHWGSLYLSFKPSFCYFEGVCAFSTIILVAVSVFGLNLGQHYQLLVLSMALIVFFTILLGFMPYAQPAANAVAVQAVALLLLTCYAGMSLLPASRPKQHHDELAPGPAYATAVSIVVVVLNLVFILSVLWRLARIMDWQAVGTKCNRFAVIVSDRIGKACNKCQGGICICGASRRSCDRLPTHLPQLPVADRSLANTLGLGPTDIATALDADERVRIPCRQLAMKHKVTH